MGNSQEVTPGQEIVSRPEYLEVEILVSHNPKSLESHEIESMIAAKQIIRNADWLAYNIFQIFHNKLWRRGGFHNQEEYTWEFQKLTGVSRSSTFAKLKLARLAFISLELTYEKFVEYGGLRSIAYLSNYLIVDKDYRLVGVKNVITSEPRAYAIGVLEEIKDSEDTSLNLTPAHKQLTVKEKFNDNGHDIYYTNDGRRIWANTVDDSGTTVKYLIVDNLDYFPVDILIDIIYKFRPIDNPG